MKKLALHASTQRPYLQVIISVEHGPFTFSIDFTQKSNIPKHVITYKVVCNNEIIRHHIIMIGIKNVYEKKICKKKIILLHLANLSVLCPGMWYH